jgi:hypothetical protein
MIVSSANANTFIFSALQRRRAGHASCSTLGFLKNYRPLVSVQPKAEMSSVPLPNPTATILGVLISILISPALPLPARLEKPAGAVQAFLFCLSAIWPAPGSADTELGVLMEPEVYHGETEAYTGVQA